MAHIQTKMWYIPFHSFSTIVLVCARAMRMAQSFAIAKTTRYEKQFFSFTLFTPEPSTFFAVSQLRNFLFLCYVMLAVVVRIIIFMNLGTQQHTKCHQRQDKSYCACTHKRAKSKTVNTHTHTRKRE